MQPICEAESQNETRKSECEIIHFVSKIKGLDRHNQENQNADGNNETQK